jgi:GT2 family glycosyltransferase
VSHPHVAILTVTTNAAGHLPAYLDALESLTYPNWSLTVVDNASSDGSAALVGTRQPAARVLQNEANLGFTGACNRALIALRDDETVGYVLFLNDDTEVTPGFLEVLIQCTEADTRGEGRTMVAPKTYLADSDSLLDDSVGDFDWWRGTWRRRVLGRHEEAEDNVAHLVGNANLSCLLVPRAAFREIGLLDDAFFVYYDDTDFCRRATDAGYRIQYEPRSVVYHRKGATLGGQLSAFGCYYLARNRPYLMRKHLSWPRFSVFLAYYLATRAARVTVWAVQGRSDLVRATATGLRDFALARMGAGRPPGSSLGRRRQRGRA